MYEPIIIEEINDHIDNSTNTIINNISNISTHYKWESSLQTISNNTMNLSITSTAESAKVLKVGSFYFSSSSNMYEYFNIFISRASMTTNVSFAGSRVNVEILISTKNVTTTTLTGYNNIIGDTTNLIYHIQYLYANSGTSTVATNSLSYNFLTAYNTIFKSGKTYYIYFVIHNYNQSSNIYIDLITPKIEIQKNYLSSVNTTNNYNIKFSGLIYPQPSGEWASSVYGTILGHNTDNLIDNNCLYNSCYSLTSLELQFCSINSNIYCINSRRNITNFDSPISIPNYMFLTEYY